MHLGYDPDVFKKPADIHKERSVVSAGLIVNDDEFRRKGFDLLIKAAEELPDIKFVLIGFNEFYLDKLKYSSPANVEAHGIVTYSKLIECYSKAKVYAQFSMFEGMPSSICEAMLCECIPVGSDVNGIPKIINGCGYIAYKRNVISIKDAIVKAIKLDDSAGVRSRTHIINNFSYQNRQTELISLINDIMN